jgi:hypothetical protein
MGLYDVPANIQKIKEETGYKNVSYIGHSEGCTQFLVASSLHTINDSDIHVGIMMAPPTTLYYNPSPSMHLEAKPLVLNTIVWLAESFFILDILPYNENLSRLIVFVCQLDVDLCIHFVKGTD